MAAYALISMERYADALPHLEASQALFEALDEPYYVCWVLHRLGYVHSNLNNTDKGIEYTEQSLALARVTHNRVALVICLYNLGSDYILDSDYVKGTAVRCGSAPRRHRDRTSMPNRPCVQFVSPVCLLSRRLHHQPGLCRALTDDH